MSRRPAGFSVTGMIAQMTETARSTRAQLLEGLPVAERRVEAGGISTAVLEGGEGAPVVLLHGPGESAAKWLRVIAPLAAGNQVIAPDLPAHGESEVPDGPLDADRMVGWLRELIDGTCTSPPVLVGHVLGGAIAARFAIVHGDRVARLVLVDTLGLARFRPSPRFAATMVGFLARPSERSYERFMRQCSFDLDALREEMGDRWEPFAEYNVDSARSPASKTAGRMFRSIGLPRIPPEDLARIAVPTTLVWGRQDRANRLRIAEAASERYGWPLHVIETCADDPPRDRPAEFVRAVRESASAP
jgi:pimeloyl-ACP methyl ester carboxylesterase